MMVLRKFAMATGLVLGTIVAVTGCSSESTESTVVALSTAPASDVTVAKNGSCEVQKEGVEAQSIPANADISAQNYPSLVVLGDVGEGATISIAGVDRCVWIKGSILKDAAIQVDGERATIIVEGSVDVESSVNVAGKNSLIWLKDNTVNIPNNSSVTGALGGEFCLGPNRSCMSA